MYTNNKTIIIYGCGGLGCNVADVMHYNEPDCRILFVDENARDGESKLGFSVVKELPPEAIHYGCIVAIGNNNERKKKFEQLNCDKVISVISERAYIGWGVEISKGTYIGHLAVIGAQAVIGENTFLSHGCYVGHDCKIAKHSFVGPNATIMGNVSIGELVFIGGGATVIDKIQIVSNVIIGAGSTVTKNILEPGIYVGSPARRIK